VKKHQPFTEQNFATKNVNARARKAKIPPPSSPKNVKSEQNNKNQIAIC